MDQMYQVVKERGGFVMDSKKVHAHKRKGNGCMNNQPQKHGRGPQHVHVVQSFFFCHKGIPSKR
jgi:hypothetical protein